MANAEKITKRKLSDEVFDRLSRMIEDQELLPGDKMPSERELMGRFGVGRPAVREALQSLEKMGLVAISHGERARVTRPTAGTIFEQINASARHLLSRSPGSLEHLKEARLFFETGMAREAARKATPADVARLRQALDRQRAQQEDAPAFVEADMAFHRTLAGIGVNPIYAALSAAMLNWLKEFHTEMLIWTGKERYTLAEHEHIIDCIEAGDPDAAVEAMSDHLKRTGAFYQSRRAEE